MNADIAGERDVMSTARSPALIRSILDDMDVPDERTAQFHGQKYISLETFRKTGQGVKTPVWFVQQDDALYVYTEANSGKIKRIRNNPQVRVAVCSMRGDVKGPWLDATASLVEGDERHAADHLLDRKYVLKRVGNFLSKFRGRERAMIKIHMT
jgi:uncharacterized protein